MLGYKCPLEVLLQIWNRHHIWGEWEKRWGANRLVLMFTDLFQRISSVSIYRVLSSAAKCTVLNQVFWECIEQKCINLPGGRGRFAVKSSVVVRLSVGDMNTELNWLRNPLIEERERKLSPGKAVYKHPARMYITNTCSKKVSYGSTCTVLYYMSAMRNHILF